MNINAKSSWSNFQNRKNDVYNIITNEKVYEQTKSYCKFLNNNLKNKHELSFLDCACGNGYQTKYISDFFNKSKFSAFDFNKLYINDAKKKYPEINWFVSNIHKNFFDHNKKFDVVYSLQTLSILEKGYKNYFMNIKKHKPKYFSGSVLLSEGNASFKSIIEMNNEKFVYNFYNKEEFLNNLREINYKNILIKKFKINIDLTKPKSNYSLGTYTIKNKNERLMISGPFIMNWFFFLAS